MVELRLILSLKKVRNDQTKGKRNDMIETI